MLKVIIVDDEYLIRQYIRNSIDWKAAGYTIVGEVGSVQAALRLIEETSPDLILTDICMPGIDGISFSGMIKSSWPQIKIVVVTGYDNFDYARRGIHVGIDRYLLKPIDDEELYHTVEELQEQILQERNHDHLLQTLVNYKKQNMKIVQEHYLRTLLEEGYVEEILSEEAEEILALSPDKLFQVVVLDKNDFSGVLFDGNVRNGSDIWLREYLSQCAEDIGKTWTTDRFGRIVLIAQENTSTVKEALKVLENKWKEHFHFSLRYGIGSIGYGLNSIRKSYLKANQNLNNAIALGDSTPVSQCDNFFEKHSLHAIEPDEVKKLYQYISTDSQLKMNALIENWFLLFKQSEIIDLSYFRINVLNIIFYLYLIDSEQEMGADFQEAYCTHYEKIFQISTLHMLKQYLVNFCQTLSKKHESTKSVRPSNLIFEIKQYMIENMTDFEMSLTGVAKLFYINSSYLSRIFKQEMGVTFVEFLSDIRIDKAKQLLRDSDLKIYEIAHQVGVENPNYLGILFKKTEGCSPLEYRAFQKKQ